MSPSRIPIEVFCSYAHEDEKWLRELEKHLSRLEQKRLISLWYDRKISPGTDCAQAIDKHLKEASIILLLISPDFMASNSCGVQMQRALKRQGGQARVIPVFLRPVDWEDAPFTHLQGLPRDGKAVTEWDKQDRAFLTIAQELREMIESISPQPVSAPRALLPRIWNVPNLPNSPFTGRDDMLGKLATMLHTDPPFQPHALSGLGGIGKTRIAIEYAYLHRDEYQTGLWTLADTRESLVSGYVAIAGLLNLPLREEQDQMLVVNAVLQWLKKHTQWLLILDNADDLALVREFLPSSTEGHVLLTTQAHAMGGLAHRLKVDSMDRDNRDKGALLLLRRATLVAPSASLEAAASSLDVALAREITEELGGLPLALDQAGAYIEETSCGLSGYLSLYRPRKADLLRMRGGLVDDHPKPVSTTWSLSLKKVAQGSPAAVDLLRLCAYLAPDAIPEAIIKQGAKHLGPSWELAATDPCLLLDEAIRALYAYSLLERDFRTQTLSVHRLVQEVVRDALPPEEQAEWMQRAVTIVNATFPDSDQVSREPWLLQALVCKEWIEQKQMVFPEATGLLLKTGRHLCEHARYEEAKPLYQRCLNIREQSLGPEHLDVADPLSGLGHVYSQQGKYREAESLYQRCLNIRERIQGPEHLDVAASLSGLANVYSEQGKYEEAEPLYQRCLDIRERIQGPEHLDVAASLSGLANLYSVQGKYKEAEPLCQRSLDIRERSLSPDHLDVASVLNNLAILRKVGGKYVEAKRFYKRNLDIRERSQGPEHFAVAQALNNLGVLYAEYGNYEEAEPLFRRSLRIREQQLTSEHPDVAQSLGNLANLLTEQGNYEEAEPLYQRGLSILERSQGREHPYVAYVLNGLAILYMKQGRYQEAEELFLRSWNIWKQRLDPEHPQIAYAINNLALLLKVQGKYEKAGQLYQQSLALFEQHLGPGHPHIRTCAIQYADTLNTQALLLQVQDSYEEAEFKYQQGLPLLEQHRGSGHHATRVCARNYAKLLHLLTREAEAQELEHRYGLSEEQS